MSTLSTNPPSRLGRRAGVAIVMLLAFTALFAASASSAFAVTDAEELTRFGSEGPAAGQISLPLGVASDSTTGHVYFSDEVNNRIDEFTTWGKFVKSFGWDVAPGAVNEEQEVRIRAGAGQFKLSFGADTTADLAFDAPASESDGPGSVEAALKGLASIGPSGVGVRGVTGNPNGVTPYLYIVTFKGPLAGSNVDDLVVSQGATPLSGGVPSSSLMVRTRADGTAGGTGLESCTAESGCQRGVEGSGTGQFDGASGIVIGPSGDIYVREPSKNRVQKFDPAGRFLLMFGGEVNKTSGADVCTKEDVEVDHDVCGAGTSGPSQGEFAPDSNIALGSSGTVFVGDVERIEAFKPDGSYDSEIKLPGETVRSLAVDPKGGGFYVAFAGGENFQPKDNVRKLSPTGTLEGSLEVKAPSALATDPAGNVYVVAGVGSIFEVKRVVEFDSGGKQLASCCSPPLLPGNPGANGLRFDLFALGTNSAGDLYVPNNGAGVHESFIRLFGPPPVSLEAPPKVTPTIAAQYASSVDRDGAVLAAQINPHFWSDARYYVQYGTGKCSEGGCETEQPLAPGSALTSKVVDASVTTTGIFLGNLKPATTYHYRFIAQSGGGGPVRGVGGKVGSDGEEGTFTTFPAANPARTDCANQAFRSGLSALLPDCRAYEMVSPVDKDNGDILSLLSGFGGAANFPTALNQSATDGNKFTYSSYRAFGDAQSAPYTSQYIARRSPGVRWESEGISPPRHESANGLPLINEYKAFSSDLSKSWLMPLAEPLFEGFYHLYRRDSISGEYKALNTVKPADGGINPELQGMSADGDRAIFTVISKQTPDAASGVEQLYMSSGGQLHLVCILPNGIPSGGPCSAGTKGSVTDFSSSVTHALSDDGSRIYWSASTAAAAPGKIYLRQNPDQPQSALSGGECSEAAKACTVPVTTKAAMFSAASPDGKKALFTILEGPKEGNLEEFELGAEPASHLIAEGVTGVAGASEDLSYVYFVSTEALDGAAIAGKSNLYLAREGAVTFIAKLAAEDVFRAGSRIPANTAVPIYRASRVSPDGRHLAFISTEPLTGYDNTDVASGEADSEVFTYEAGSAGPLCVSCNPSGARPEGREVQAAGNAGTLATAASIPTWENQLTAPRSLSDDGRRLFFNSYDALLPRDTNGKVDVYEWETAAGAEDCVNLGAELYVEASAGCLSLISSGESPRDSEFADASPTGSDVFFTTAAGLLPQDPGLIDVYDARAGGGLPSPAARLAACEGEACQGPPAPPNDPTPASSTFEGAGNVRQGAPRPHCAKGKVRRKGHCVRKKKPKSRAQAGNHSGGNR